MSTFSLDAVVKSVAKAEAPATKKARPSESANKNTAAPDLFMTLAQTLHGVRQKILDLHLAPQTVEIEFRIGMLVSGSRRWQSSWPTGGCLSLSQEQAQQMGVSFVSGIDEVAVGRLKQLLLDEGYTTSFSEQRVRMGSNSGRRSVVDAHGHETISETKMKILRLDLGCVGHQYDGRLEVATEVANSSSGGGGGRVEKWTMERLKRRTTFRKTTSSSSSSSSSGNGSGGSGAWQVDLTEVTTTQLHAEGSSSSSGNGSGSGTEQNTELEFELTPGALQQWLSCGGDEAQTTRLTSALATELQGVLNTCIVQTSEESTGTSSKIVSMPKNSTMQLEVRKLNSTIISASRPKTSFSADDFLGSMPLNISRRNLLRLQREDYFVTEKSDGVRYLMYVLPGTPSDRAGNFFRPPGAEAIAAGLKVGTVLDGEIVFNLHFRKQLFLVFDVLCNEGQPCAHLPFGERTALIASSIMTKCGHIDYKAAERPLWIIRKKFYPKKDLKQLLRFMVSHKGSRIYKESERRHHKSDGLIFQPHAPYVFGTDVDLVKWKWPELASVDLQVLPNARQAVSKEPSLMAGGPDGTLVDCCMRGRSHVGLGRFDTFRLLADIQQSSCVAHIAEVGLWSYFQLRKDKDTPNFINTVMSILMEQAEDISIAELQERLLLPPS